VSRPELDEIALADPAAAWAALGFTVREQSIALGGVRIRLGAAAKGLKLRELDARHDLDGLPIVPSTAPPPPPPTRHPNGASAIDHVVAHTPDLARTTSKLTAAGLDHRPSPAPQEFFVLGPCLLELVERPGDPPGLWGLTLVVEDLDEAARQLGNRLGRVKQAVQPGRRIATVRTSEAGLSTALALMTPR
jgi:hypothetical protein